MRARRLLVLLLAVPLALGLPACADDDGDGDEAATTTSEVPTTAGDGADGGTRLADVSVTVEGEAVGLERACRGVDGALVTVSTTGRRIILVREEGLAIRLSTEGGTFTETSDVTTTEIGEVTRYAGTVPVEGQPTPVTIEVRDGADLPVCEELRG